MAASSSVVCECVGAELLAAVQIAMQQTVERAGHPLGQVCAHLLTSGSRIRARLLLAIPGPLTDPSQQRRAVQAAAAIELLHTATLLQDDIFDNGHTRRGRPATHLLFSEALATLASDWLLVEALRIAAEVDARYHSLLVRAAQEMTIAEALELHPPALHTLTEARHHIRAIALGKTGALFGAALAGGAILRNASSVSTQDHWKLGQELGVTFQMIDDAKDIFCSSAEIGKDVQQDLASGRLTFPILAALDLLERRPGSTGVNLLLRREFDGNQRHELLDVLHCDPLQNNLKREIRTRCAEHEEHSRQLKLFPALAGFMGELRENDRGIRAADTQGSLHQTSKIVR